MMLDGEIVMSEYRAIKSEYEERIKLLFLKRVSLELEKDDYRSPYKEVSISREFYNMAPRLLQQTEISKNKGQILVSDENATYFGGKLNDQTLTPGSSAK